MFLGKEKESSKNKCVTVKVIGRDEELYFWKAYLTQCLLAYPVYNIQFNLWKTHFRVTGIKVIITKLRYWK